MVSTKPKFLSKKAKINSKSFSLISDTLVQYTLIARLRKAPTENFKLYPTIIFDVIKICFS